MEKSLYCETLTLNPVKRREQTGLETPVVYALDWVKGIIAFSFCLESKVARLKSNGLDGYQQQQWRVLFISTVHENLTSSIPLILLSNSGSCTLKWVSDRDGIARQLSANLVRVSAKPLNVAQKPFPIKEMILGRLIKTKTCTRGPMRRATNARQW